MGHAMSNKDRSGSRPPADESSNAAGATFAKLAAASAATNEKAIKARMKTAVDEFVETQLVNERRGFLDEARRDAIERVNQLDQQVAVLFKHLEARTTWSLRLAAFSILLLGATWGWIYLNMYR